MNIVIYKFTNYRAAFAELFQVQRQRRPGWSSARLAEQIQVQPSHLSNVVKERGHFTSDQIFQICAELGLNEDETAYMDLLMEWERAAHPARKKKLHAAIQAIRDHKLRADKELKAAAPMLSHQQSESYYLDPNIELLHLYLGCEDALFETAAIAQLWGLSPDYVAQMLALLEGAGLIVKQRQRWQVKPIHQLMPSSSPLCKPQQMLKRVRALEALQKLPADRIYSFQGTLTMNEETRLQIQARFVDFLKEIEPLVLESPSENIFHLQFDLFPWLENKKSRK